MEAGLISVMTGLHSEKTAALLRKAVKRGKEKKVLRLLEKEPTLLNSDLPHHAVLLNPHIKSEGQPLAVAAKHGQLGVARLLLERGAHIDTVGYWGTALHWAAREGHEEMVALLLSKGAQASSRDAIGSTPFMEACMYGQLGVMQMLLEHTGAQTLEEQDRLERTALQCAACSGNEEAVAFLLSKGMQANSRDKTGTTPLMEACQEKKALGVVRLLLQHRGGRGLDETDECGRAALHLAVSEGIEKMVAFLLSQGADATIRDGEGFTPFLTACHWGNVGVAQMLLRHMGGQGLEERDAYERTGLHLACGEYSNSTMVRFLLLAGADPSVRDDQGETPRAVAEEWSYESVDVLNWWDGELERRQVLCRAVCLHKAYTMQRVMPTSQVPSYLEGRVATGRALPSVEVVLPQSWKRRQAGRSGKRKADEERELMEAGKNEERHAMVHFVMHELNEQLVTELLEGFHS